MEKIILLHGALGHGRDLGPLTVSLQKKGFQTQLFDFSGHGNKPFSVSFSVHAFVDELREYMGRKENAASHIFGYSMGGYVALKMCAEEAFTGKLFTLGTRLTWSPDVAKAEIARLDVEKMQEKIPEFTRRLYDAHGEKWKVLVQKTADLLDDLGKNNYLTNDLLSLVSTRVCLGLGDKDTMADAADTLRVSKLLPKGQMYMLPGTRHQIESVNTDLLAEIISAGIKE